jgi:hypothetical protein
MTRGIKNGIYAFLKEFVYALTVRGEEQLQRIGLRIPENAGTEF